MTTSQFEGYIERAGGLDPPREEHLLDAAIECGHLAVRPQREVDAYVCDSCQRELTPLEAQEVSSEASLRTLRLLR